MDVVKPAVAFVLSVETSNARGGLTENALDACTTVAPGVYAYPHSHGDAVEVGA